jgi:hypothetical protein
MCILSSRFISKNIRLIYLEENTASPFMYAVTKLMHVTERNIFCAEDERG